MKSTKKLLSITNLKKYFPVAKSSIFQKNQLYVRANEDITLDIFEGETIGIVGESGCGKSTLGRVILQLYPQTAGTTMYYGTTVDEITPAYIKDTLVNSSKYRQRIAKATEKRIKLEEKVEAVGGEDNADFYLLQRRNLARCDEKTALDHFVKLVGGFYSSDISSAEQSKGIKMILDLFEISKDRNIYLGKRNKLQVEYEHLLTLEDSSPKKKASLEKSMADLDKILNKYNQKILKGQTDLDNLRAELSSRSEDFKKYEAMRDTGIDLSRLKYNEMRHLRKDLQIVFQDPYSSLNPRMTVGQIIAEGLTTHGFFKSGSQKMREHILKTMVDCGLQEYMINRYPHQFSGGQRQRISIARSLAVNPKFVVLDECVSALDVSIQSQIINLLEELKEKQGLTYMFISHDLSVVKYISDRICVMYLGSVVELAESDKIFQDPRHPYTVALLSSIPTTDVDDVNRERILLEGNIPSPIMPPSGCKFHTRCYMACEKCKRVPPPLQEIEPGHFVACHFTDKKIDENGKYLFDTEQFEKKSQRS